MTLLAELAADGQDERLRRGVEYMLADTEAGVRKEGHGWVCFWGNLLRYALHCGFDDDPRVARLTGRVVRDATAAGWRCQHNDGLPCAWGAARALWDQIDAATFEEERRAVEELVRGIEVETQNVDGKRIQIITVTYRFNEPGLGEVEKWPTGITCRMDVPPAISATRSTSAPAPAG